MKKIIMFILLQAFTFSLYADDTTRLAQKEELYNGDGLEKVCCGLDSGWDTYCISTDRFGKKNIPVQVFRIMSTSSSAIKYEIYLDGQFYGSCNNVELVRD